MSGPEPVRSRSGGAPDRPPALATVFTSPGPEVLDQLSKGLT
jgi:hypothetical protein